MASEQTGSGSATRSTSPRSGKVTLKELAVLFLVTATLVYFAPDRENLLLPKANHFYHQRQTHMKVLVEAVGPGEELWSQYSTIFRMQNQGDTDSLRVIRYYSPKYSDEQCVLYYIGSMDNNGKMVAEYVIAPVPQFNRDFRPSPQTAGVSVASGTVAPVTMAPTLGEADRLQGSR